MDALEQDDIERSRATAPDVKLAQALEMMAAGMRLQRAKIERANPDATAEQVEQMFRAWLEKDE